MATPAPVPPLAHDEGSEGLVFRELSDRSKDLMMLEAFYHQLYIKEFPDPNERESLANMRCYLQLKRQGWYGHNNYHIILTHRQGQLVGASVSDYLAEANSGVIEFLLVVPEARGGGIGRALLAHTEALLDADARSRVGQPLAFVIGEVNDPFLSDAEADNLDPVERCLIWHRWGYRYIDFPYVQPALSEGQQSVSHLFLIAHPLADANACAIPAQLVRTIVSEYLRWAFRIEEPQTCPEFRAMVRHFAGHDTIRLGSLAHYVGIDPKRPLAIEEIRSPKQADFAGTMAVYQRCFPQGPLVVPTEAFAAALEQEIPGGFYHLWALRAVPAEPVAGLAAFFSLPGAGFGGYLGLEPPLNGNWRTGLLLARIELQMRADGTDPPIRGWYVEVEPRLPLGPYRRLGFHEVAVVYRQPSLVVETPSQTVRLLYKPIGRSYGPPALSVEAFLRDLQQIYRVVYWIGDPLKDDGYQRIRASLPDEPTASVPWLVQK